MTAGRIATAGTTIVVDTTTADLPPGSHVRIEASAEYRLLEFGAVKADERGRPMISRTASDDNVKYRLAANAPLVWDFVVPANKVVPSKQFRLTFSKDLAPAPRGMAATVTFPIKYTVDIPASNGKPAMKTEQTSRASMRIPADGNWARCLRVENWQQGLFVGVTPDCKHDLRNDRTGRLTPAGQ